MAEVLIYSCRNDSTITAADREMGTIKLGWLVSMCKVNNTSVIASIGFNQMFIIQENVVWGKAKLPFGCDIITTETSLKCFTLHLKCIDVLF